VADCCPFPVNEAAAERAARLPRVQPIGMRIYTDVGLSAARLPCRRMSSEAETAIRKRKFSEGCRPSVAAGLSVVALALPLAILSAPGEAAFPGTPGKISFDSTRDGNTEIYVMNADGSNQTRLTNNPAIDRDAAFSPNGQTIAFVSERVDSEGTADSEVYVMDADGSHQTQLTHNTAEDLQPAFSPNGKQIAFMSDRDGDMEIYLMDADVSNSSNQTRLTTNATFDGQPTFSPDGSLIAFASNRDPLNSNNFDIYTMNSDGSNSTNPSRLTTSAASESRPNFSPDGSRIAFRTDRDGNGEIYVMTAGGKEETRLTFDPELDGEPAFSPNGRQIAFRTHRDDGKAEIYVMNDDGSNQTNLTENPFADRRPDWQPIPAPTTVSAAPSGTTIRAGSPAGGDASSLAAADSAYYQVSSTNSSIFTSEWYGSFTGLPSTLSGLRVTYQGSNSRSCSQTISIFNWSSGTWSALASRKVGATEVRIADIAVGGTQSNYVGGGELRVRVRCTTSRGTFVANGNQLQISYQR
jgi:Tol biopolymer transport system component